MIAKVIVDIPSKSVDFKFDYIVLKFRTCDSNWRSRCGTFWPRTIQGYVMNIQQKPDGNMDISKLKK